MMKKDVLRKSLVEYFKQLGLIRTDKENFIVLDMGGDPICDVIGALIPFIEAWAKQCTTDPHMKISEGYTTKKLEDIVNVTVTRLHPEFRLTSMNYDPVRFNCMEHLHQYIVEKLTHYRKNIDHDPFEVMESDKWELSVKGGTPFPLGGYLFYGQLRMSYNEGKFKFDD